MSWSRWMPPGSGPWSCDIFLAARGKKQRHCWGFRRPRWIAACGFRSPGCIPGCIPRFEVLSPGITPYLNMPALSHERFQQLAGWFEAALRIPLGPAREQYVTQVSAGDETVREELLRLLES